MIVKMNETNSNTNGYSDINTISIQSTTNTANKKFVLLSEESIKSIGDQNGFDNLSDEVIRLLSSDVSYRIRQLVHNSIQLMRQSKRRRLTTADINRALESSDCEKVFGFEASDDPIQECLVKEAKVFVVNDSIVDLNQEMNKIFERTDCALNLFEDDIRLDIDLDLIEEKHDSNEDFLNSDDCCEELKQFYQNLVKAIIGTNNNLFLIAIRDLSSNRRISKVLPYIINFIINGIRRLSHDISQLKRFLQTIQCLLRNPSLHLATDPFQSILIQSILECIIEPLNPMSDHWTLRNTASHLLANVLNEWFNPLEGHRILNQTFDSLRNCLLDFSKPFSSHYGVFKAFQSLGYDIIVRYLYPILEDYFNHLLPIIDSNNLLTEPQTRIDGLTVFGEILFITELICLKSRTLLINDSEIKLNIRDYNQFSEIFGDSLCARLPINFDKIRSKFYSEKNKNRCEREISLFESIDSQKSGEDLLDAFYEAPIHLEDNDMRQSDMNCNPEDDTFYSCEDNYAVSDNERETNDTHLVLIKSTISDPTLGIKVTFKKLKREHNPSEVDTKDTKRSRTNRKSYSLISEPVFEANCLKQSSIRFNYGTNRTVVGKDYESTEPSKWYILTMTKTNPSSYILRKRFKINKNIKHLSLYSCDLFNVI